MYNNWSVILADVEVIVAVRPYQDCLPSAAGLFFQKFETREIVMSSVTNLFS